MRRVNKAKTAAVGKVDGDR